MNIKEFYELIKEKEKNAENDIVHHKLQKEVDTPKILTLQGQALGYLDVILNLQTSGLLEYYAGLFERLEKLERYLDKWNEQLGIDGVNSKGMVRNDIQYLIKERTEW